MMRHLFAAFLILISFTQTKAQVRRLPAKTVQGIDEKKALAKDFFEQSGMKEEMNMAILFGEGYLNRAPPEKNSEVAAQNKKIYELAKAKWQKRKETLAAELTQQLLKDIEVTFSVPELKYLIEVSKASVFKRYKLFLKSDEFGKVYNMPTLIARGFVEEGRKAISGPVKGPAK